MLTRTRSLLSLGLIAALLIGANVARARTKADPQNRKLPPQAKVSVTAFDEIRVHKVGKFWLSVSNYGIFGSQSGRLVDPCTRQAAPSAEFPAGTGVDYCFQGALWIGGLKEVPGSDPETLVTVGEDGWESVQEVGAEMPFEARTIRPSGLQLGGCLIPFSPDAVSEQDLIAVYSDTFAAADIDPNDGSPYKPLGIKVTQKSYSWSYDYAEDFILFDYLIENVTERKLNGVYLALYVDADNHNTDLDGDGFTDDISGFKHAVPSFRCPALYEDTLNLAWTADNDGLSNCQACDDNKNGVFVPTISPTSIAGTRVIKAPSDLQFSFNWWVSNGTALYDFGPWTKANVQKRPGLFQGNVYGTPVNNKGKYFIMSNGEFDYDQLFAGLSIWSDDSGWISIPDQSLAFDIADGYDTRYLLSFGPFNINPGQTLPLTLAYIAGEDFHVKPGDWQIVNGKFSDVNAVVAFNKALDFTDFGTNARWAGWVYDNPGVDTDGDGNRGKYRFCEGDTVYYEGDGVPDFTGPPPPESPKLSFKAEEGKVTVIWNGERTETVLDYFSNVADFEGYRIHLSRSGLASDYALLDSYDKDDIKMYIYNPGNQKWSLKVASVDADSIVKKFQKDNVVCEKDGSGGCPCYDTCNGCTAPEIFGNDPLKWTLSNPYEFKAACGDTLEVVPGIFVTQTYDQNSNPIRDKVAFEAQDWNQDLMSIKVWADSIQAGTIGPTDPRYYDYAYVIDSLNPSTPVYISVTAFDFGNPQTNLAPLETSVLVNAVQIWPLPAPPTGTIGKKVVVFPNPYRITEIYPLEDRNLPSGKRIHFVQLPGECKIRIYTLDGDEVAVIENNDPTAAEISWNLISSNNQEVVAGVYIYQVESASGSQIGKFVVIK